MKHCTTEVKEVVTTQFTLPERLDGLNDVDASDLFIKIHFGLPAGPSICLTSYPPKYESLVGYRPCLIRAMIQIQRPSSCGKGRVTEEIVKSKAVGEVRAGKPSMDDIKELSQDIGEAISDLISDIIEEAKSCLRQQST